MARTATVQIEGVYPDPAAFVFWEKGPPSVLPLRLLTKAKLVDAEPGAQTKMHKTGARDGQRGGA